MLHIRRFSELTLDDGPRVGGKNASLGELYQKLTPQGVMVPNGFATTADAYHHYIRHNKLHERITQILNTLDTKNLGALATAGVRIRNWIMHGTLPGDLADELNNAYRELEQEYGPNPDVAVRSSAAADQSSASFAGQHETYLNIRGSRNLLETCRRVYASLFTDRAISYRAERGFSPMDVALSIGVQKMVRSDIGASGAMFTLDRESGFRDVVYITAAYGLGENVVQGKVNPDEYYVFKPTLTPGHCPIIKRHLGDKAIKMIYAGDPMAGVSTRNVPVPVVQCGHFALSDDEVMALARHAVIIETHYSQRAGHDMPMDIEWAKDGESGDLYIVQARPESVHSKQPAGIQEIYELSHRGPVLAIGKGIGQKIAAGRARVILEAEQMHDLLPGEVLITDITDPDWEPIMKIAGAIVTDRGGRASHAAIVARELGIPAVVGCGDATQRISNGRMITVSCAEGDNGYVYDGTQPISVRHIDLTQLARPRTRIMLNIGNPEQAFEAARLPCDGVGLARLEFIISTSLRIHPRAALDYERLDANTCEAINKLSAGYDSPTRYYVERLAEGIGTIAAAFYPKPVIVRLSDFKTNEYANLLGGAAYEPKEENPMLGWRGAARYPSPNFVAAFALECAALKKVRNTMGLSNVALMIPFVRSVAEGGKVLELLATQGLRRGENGLKIYLMCEIPANALLADEFLEHFDGFSIGSNDLTQLALGVDRDSRLVGGMDERNPAVLKLMELAIAACRRQGKYIGICGQAPSDFPEITRWLVEHGIDSISLNADSVLRMTTVVLEMEQQV